MEKPADWRNDPRNIYSNEFKQQRPQLWYLVKSMFLTCLNFGSKFL